MAKIVIDLNLATAYYHQTNGRTECKTWTICQSFGNYVNPKSTKWTCHLRSVQTAINATPGDCTCLSPFESPFGTTINLLLSIKVLTIAFPSPEDIASQILKN